MRPLTTSSSPEQARIHPDQLLILLEQVRCAAFELPFRDGETFGAEDLGEMLSYLRDEGVLQRQGDQWFWVADSYPANAVSLRSVAEGKRWSRPCRTAPRRADQRPSARCSQISLRRMNHGVNGGL